LKCSSEGDKNVKYFNSSMTKFVNTKYKHLYKQPMWQKMCMCFSMWTKANWARGWPRWCNDLMDEGLHRFGLAKSAKTMDIWPSWGFEGTSIFLVCVFYFLVLFVLCRWWVLFRIFHGMGGDQHWSTWNVCCIWLGCLIENNGWQV